MTNAANGSDWHLDIMNDGFTAVMSSNFTYPQPGGSFAFEIMGDVNKVAFSSISTPGATSMPSTSTNRSHPFYLLPSLGMRWRTRLGMLLGLDMRWAIRLRLPCCRRLSYRQPNVGVLSGIKKDMSTNDIRMR